ncbi:hypothetical protein EVAR_99576_1 [Eumeta japonica]|uniref:Uncharacterized protein n=1 Tax=Eumeta variegata TaxID=151549 RepID=A0A4C1SZ78_EUMVA|nr:hypothetical protein EVAR_99576_1 [Eumeta japonica]
MQTDVFVNLRRFFVPSTQLDSGSRIVDETSASYQKAPGSIITTGGLAAEFLTRVEFNTLSRRSSFAIRTFSKILHPIKRLCSHVWQPAIALVMSITPIAVGMNRVH